MSGNKREGDPHLLIVEAYEGHLEHLDEEDSSPGLGLPLEAIAEALDCRITVLDWAEWRQFEHDGSSFTRWAPFPATRPIDDLAPPKRAEPRQLTRRSVPARDPDTMRPFAEGLSARTHGLLAESDPLFLASFVLNQYLEELSSEDPFDAVIVPMFGGLGYVAQMSRATGAGLRNTRFATLVSGTSAERQAANGEGLWTRPAITRRQMEDLSLGLADLAICFGPLGRRRAEAGNAREIVEAPRFVPSHLLHSLGDAGPAEPPSGPVSFYIHEPLEAASGTLLTLDAVRSLMLDQQKLERPITCSGTNMRFAPNLPRDFRSYWSSRGWARSLAEQGYWRWSDKPDGEEDEYRVRLFPSLFEHLPNVWVTLAAGEAVLLSCAAAEGVAKMELFPRELLLEGEPTPQALADRLIELQALGASNVDKLRKQACAAVIAAFEGPEHASRLARTAAALERLLTGGGTSPSLASAALRLLDGRLAPDPRTAPPRPAWADAPPTLTVAIPCYEMGDLLIETVESVWAATRLPDELLIVDDGSRGAETASAIEELVRRAAERGLPLAILRQTNMGLAAARNTALAVASSTYISFIDGDDLIGADFYALALETLVANPGLGGVAAWAETFGEGVASGFWNAPQPELPLLLAENTVFVPCMSPVGLLRSLGGYDTRQRYNYEDWELAIRILAEGYPIVTIPRYLQRYRVRADSLLRTMSDVQNQVMREEMFRNHHATITEFGPELAAQIEHKLMRQAARQAERPAEPSMPAQSVVQLLRTRAKERLQRSIAEAGRRLLRRPT